MVIQVILTLLVVFIIWRVVDKFQRHEIVRGELVSWFVFWLAVIFLVWWPDFSQRVAEFVGVGRGVDLVVYLALFLVFYLIFRIFVRLERIEKNITKIVRKVALDEAENEDKSDFGK